MKKTISLAPDAARVPPCRQNTGARRGTVGTAGEMKVADPGFSLVELVISMAVLAILLALATPSYVNYVEKARRSESQVTLLGWANREEMWRADNISYSTAMSPPDTQYYTFSMVNTATSFTLTATAIGTQLNDMEGVVSCGSLSINELGVQGPSGHEKCWSK